MINKEYVVKVYVKIVIKIHFQFVKTLEKKSLKKVKKSQDKMKMGTI